MDHEGDVMTRYKRTQYRKTAYALKEWSEEWWLTPEEACRQQGAHMVTFQEVYDVAIDEPTSLVHYSFIGNQAASLAMSEAYKP